MDISLTPNNERVSELHKELQKGLDDVKNNRYSDALGFLETLMLEDIE